MQWIQAGDMPAPQIAAEVLSLVERTVLRLLTAAADTTGVRDALLTGRRGLLASCCAIQMLRDRPGGAGWGCACTSGGASCAGDDAAGVALIGRDRIMKEKL